jgi:hypothetical protein
MVGPILLILILPCTSILECTLYNTNLFIETSKQGIIQFRGGVFFFSILYTSGEAMSRFGVWLVFQVSGMHG